MINSNTKINIKNTINDIYKLKPKKQNINDNRNSNNIQKSQMPSKFYLTINLDKTTKEKDQVLMLSTYQTIKKENKKAYTSNHSKQNSRNIFITTINELNNKNKTSYITPKREINNKIIYQDNEHFNKNKEIKKLKNSFSNECFTENNYNIKNNKIIYSAYHRIFDENKLNKNKVFTSNNSIKKLNTINNEKKFERNRKKTIIYKINNSFSKKDITTIKLNSNNNNRIRLNINNNIDEQEIKSNNIKKNNDIFKSYYNTNNNYMNKSLNVSNHKKNQKKSITSELKKSIRFSNKGMNILNKIIKKRKYQIWKDIKYKITNSKYFNNNIFNVQSISYNNFQIKNNFIKDQLLNDFNKNENILKNCINRGKKIINLKKNRMLYSPKSTNKNEIINQKKLDDNSENQKLKSKLKNFYLKYLVEKKIHIHNFLLQKSLYIINKNNIIINNKENKIKYLLKQIISRTENTKKYILKKAFIKFNFRCKLSNQKRNFFCFKDFQDEFILMQKLYQIFYQKEKNNTLVMKKYFDKFRYNTLLKNQYSASNFHYNKNSLKKRNRNLKIIISNIIKHNNIFIKNILNKWLLRSKIIKLMQNSQINNECKNNIQKEDLIKGINKLNNIFNTYKNIKALKDTNKKKNKNKDVENYEQKDCNNINEANNIIENIYSDKYQIDSIIEEKEEEDQTE